MIIKLLIPFVFHGFLIYGRDKQTVSLHLRFISTQHIGLCVVGSNPITMSLFVSTYRDVLDGLSAISHSR